MDTANKLIGYIQLSLSWLPVEFYEIFLGLVFVKFADGILGIVHRGWTAIGRG